MLLSLLLLFCWGSGAAPAAESGGSGGSAEAGYYFSEATVLAPDGQSFAGPLYLLLNRRGKIELAAEKPINLPQKPPVVVEGALIVPHFVDGYSLIQERGLGGDDDETRTQQRAMARYLTALGVARVRDPIYPRSLLIPAWSGVTPVAQGGYLDMPDGGGAGFGVVLGDGETFAALAQRLPASGPITLWWRRPESGEPVPWTADLQRTRDLIHYFHAKGRKVGVWWQDARAPEIQLALSLPFDFFEGIPDYLNNNDLSLLYGRVWLPLAALNDRRYCADGLAESLPQLGHLGLYEDDMVRRVLGRVGEVKRRIGPRCTIWRERRPQVLAWLQQHLAAKQPVAVGSAGGHLFAFSGDIATELALWRELGADDGTVLRALYDHTPALLGMAPQRLKLTAGQDAHFVVYRLKTNVSWSLPQLLTRIPGGVDYNFTGGQMVYAAP
ncbi:hypothetical protein [Acanthopleuribacter pedis]|uniref:Amidohydrolase 3 domain-containing protein n=1 Tax=Acanthopleuribacter pedis TaxID=442870 RepID=A0A8J7Q985_9BACT|nr:hypothetical protein [Acanthopleuribacter pedis]MBO1319764.1 hypothetical protein [Acanthopleuribacter pedis]